MDAALPEAAERVAQARRGGHDCVVVSAGPAEAGRPAVELPLLAAGTFARQRGHALAADPRITGLRVMVVEDNELNRQVVAGFLRHLGATVELFPAAAPALERLAAARFDVALLDLQLEGENGLELAQALRAMPAGAALPIVFLSAHFEEEDRMTAAGLGALACLSKPFDPDELRALLAPLPHESAPAPAPAPPPPTPHTASLRALFAGLWPGQREAIEKAADHHALRRAVHALRGSLAMLGERAAVALARTVEEGLLAGHPTAALPLAALLASAEAIAQG